MSTGKRFINLSGMKFNKLTILDYYEIRNKHAYWLCKCDCGNTKFIKGSHVKSGRTKSCGCMCGGLHGKSSTRIFRIWVGIKKRCSDITIQNYAGRGITICDEWKSDFMNFYKWSIENGYSDELTIDRIDNDGNYEPSNCRWATYKDQANNTRSNRIIEYNNKRLTLMEWSEETGLKRETIAYRLNNGWNKERALTEKSFIGKNQSFKKEKK